MKISYFSLLFFDSILVGKRPPNVCQEHREQSALHLFTHTIGIRVISSQFKTQKIGKPKDFIYCELLQLAFYQFAMAIQRAESSGSGRFRAKSHRELLINSQSA